MKGNLYVNIEVLDSNDNIPSFGNKKYSTEIREDAAIGKRVIKVNQDLYQHCFIVFAMHILKNVSLKCQIITIKLLVWIRYRMLKNNYL